MDVLTDPIADMITRIRNGGQARLKRVGMPESRLKREVARVLQEQGYISSYSSDGDPKKPVLTVEVRYNDGSEPMIQGIQRVSRPSRRVYVGWQEIPKVRNGLGIAILSTPRGILTDQQAREAHVGGEILAEVW
ncbi:MAG: 30S ribosomal protein S8 [Myxococcales bacterium]|nr:30S ribosomal protein S8 [Myxococcales bacterium]TDJ02637.1 MAG: 30S ribosomal protein S8 [Deltaproteobacteria bacterium]TDJ07018.1 MAG: 30S ribosomal protein S8 [Deltaproteobacteria bacterium]